jgi:hypothetical protein
MDWEMFALLSVVSDSGDISLAATFTASVCLFVAGRIVVGSSRWWLIGVLGLPNMSSLCCHRPRLAGE